MEDKNILNPVTSHKKRDDVLYIFLCFVDRVSWVSLWIVNQLDALIFSNIFICRSLSTCFGHYVPIIRRDPIALTQLLYLSFRFSCVSSENCGWTQFTHSSQRINIFEKISASSWFTIHKFWILSCIWFVNLICVWPCIINVGRVNMEHQLDATITVLLISKISSTCFRQTFAHLQERKTEIFTTYGIMSCWCDMQGFWALLLCTTCTVWR
jgi:hypothetical protein